MNDNYISIILNNFSIIIFIIFIIFLIILNLKNNKKNQINLFDNDIEIFLKNILVSFKDISLNIKKINNTDIKIQINIENIENIENSNIEEKLNSLIKNELEKYNEILREQTNFNIVFDKNNIKINVDILFKDESYFNKFIWKNK